MSRKQYLTGFASSAAMLILILDGRTAVEGASAGLDLCVKTVIPSLFPFFVLSILQTNSLTGISIPFLQSLGSLYKIPRNAESLLLSGYLGGYPVGAQCISCAYREGALCREDAERMLAFCNNAGPAFLFGMIGSLFPSIHFAWALWGIHILSSFLVAVCIPGKPGSNAQIRSHPELSLADALKQALQIMAVVCGWVIVFRVIITFFQRWLFFLFPIAFQVALTGVLELSNGCWELSIISPVSLRFVLCSCMLAFGGICVLMQTISITQGLSLRFYIAGKLLQTFFSFLICVAVIETVWFPVLILVLLFLVFLRKTQKKSSIPAWIRV